MKRPTDALSPLSVWVPGLAQRPEHRDLEHALRELDGDAFPSVEAISRLLQRRDVRTATGSPLRAELQVKPKRRPPGTRSRETLYDVRIDALGLLPTRTGSYHDLFNALVWATFPAAKAAIAARQHRAWRRLLPPSFERLPGARTREQDALAMLDEGGLVFAVTAPHLEAVRTAVRIGDAARLREGHALRVVVFGHALHEHFVSGSEGLRASALCLAVDALDDRTLDLALAAHVEHAADDDLVAGDAVGFLVGVSVEGLLLAPT